MTTTGKRHFGAFNGDADGICALIQLRRAEPKESILVTGVKRDINLLKRVDAVSGDTVTALDIAFEKNSADAARILDAGASIFYADHHNPGELPSHPALEAHINTAPDTCTSLIIDQLLGGQYRAWAIAAAFGDNLTDVAQNLADQSGFTAEQAVVLKKLGVCINYNGYGASLDDLFYHPAELYQLMDAFDTPFDFIEALPEVFETLANGYDSDMASAASLAPIRETSTAATFMLPNEQWARRVSGVYGNDLANRSPSRAHAVITEKADDTYQVSVRAPLTNKSGADELVKQFPTGGGRKGAAGINALPKEQLDAFISAFEAQYS
ncbi:DHH family phosphoesterase [Pontibacterium sp. N1Y112]|uniref:DHH family phosphoesterase n=1 Tax=Pontibacterium sinense TaxID=2781979 RepID=A0A8J7FEX8_9GAMM|nr:DHH family phosphoesterase [Pontibacterium sinense]MBE9398409.1 DHH family phosphoesterase [Pontibacterium sinense]